MLAIDWNLVIKRCVCAFIWGLSLAVGAYNVSVSSGVMGAFIGGLLGFFLGLKLADSRLRLPSILVGGLIAFMLCRWLSYWPVSSQIIASILGPISAYELSDGLVWFLCSSVLVSTLHAATLRSSWFIALEISIISASFISPLVGHRDGYISRPHFFVDPLWAQGFDPVPWFIAVGVLLTCILLFFIVGRFNKRNTVIDLSLLLLIAVLVGIFLPINKLKELLPERQAMEVAGQSDDKKQSKASPPSPNQDKQDKDSKGKDNQDQDKNDKNKDNDNDNDKEKDNSSSQSPPVALVVFYSDYLPNNSMYYFRQSVQSQFNGRRLITPTINFADNDVAKRFPSISSSEKLLQPEPLDEQYFKPVETRVSLIAPHSAPFGLVNPQSFKAINNPDSSQFISAYEVRSMCFTSSWSDLVYKQVGNPNWTEEQRKHYLALPNDPRYQQLANTITAKVPEKYKDNPVAKILLLTMWMEDNITYDNSVKVTDEQDVVAKFLFGSRIGYCVHIANSLAYLTRSIGIPSRVGSGYACDPSNRYGGSYLLIQGSNSHAWCEVYLQGLGWVPIDPSIKKSNNPPAQPPDPDLQKMLGQIARNDTGDAQGEPQEKQIDLQEQSQRLTKYLGILLIVVLVIAVLAAYITKIIRRLAPYFGTLDQRIDRVFRASLDDLADVGIYRGYGEAREDFALRISHSIESLVAITEFHMRKSLGNKKMQTKADTATLTATYKALKQQIRANIPWWRRWLGLLNPISWLFVK